MIDSFFFFFFFFFPKIRPLLFFFSEKKPASISSLKMEHNWVKVQFNSPTYCSECEGFLWGVGYKQGYRCSLCRFVAHGKCRHNVTARCKPTTESMAAFGSSSSSSLSTDAFATAAAASTSADVDNLDEQMSSNLVLDNSTHCFIPGNISLFKKCVVCRRGFGWSGFTGVQCSQCNCCIHTQCAQECPESLLRCMPVHVDLLLSTALAAETDGCQDAGCTPLVCFVNSRSGGGQGLAVQRKLQRLLAPAQVFDLSEGGPERGLRQFLKIKHSRILVCGGDGSACWVLSVLDAIASGNDDDDDDDDDDRGERQASAGSSINVDYPPFAMLPLGTGNDLARYLGWGGGYEGEDLSPLLHEVSRATVDHLDRWTVRWSDGDERAMIMNNYFSAGVDAQVALDFHTLREERPELFSSRAKNKMVYAKFGLKAVNYTGQANRLLEVFVDGEPFRNLPDDVQGFIVLNISSYGGGTDMWGMKRPGRAWSAPTSDDGILELIGVRGSAHIGAIRAGMANGIRLGQARSLAIRVREPIAAQVDGEPFMSEPSLITITLLNRVPVLRKSSSKSPSSSSSSSSSRHSASPSPFLVDSGDDENPRASIH
jgi:diacylglycerol kinase (ATP)